MRSNDFEVLSRICGLASGICAVALLATLAGCAVDASGPSNRAAAPVDSSLLSAGDGVSVTVTNARNGERICDARVIARDGEYAMRLRTVDSPNCRYIGVPRERGGLYEIEVTREGFASTVVTNVEATPDLAPSASESVVVHLPEWR